MAPNRASPGATLITCLECTETFASHEGWYEHKSETGHRRSMMTTEATEAGIVPPPAATAKRRIRWES